MELSKMIKLTLVSTALAGSLLLAGPLAAQTSTTSKAPSGAMKMSQSECDTVWNKLDSSHSGNVAQAQASGSITDFKKADLNNDGKLSRTEFQQACSSGLVKSSSTTGAGTGTTGAATSPSSPSTSPTTKK
jgi:hypothetical protein